MNSFSKAATLSLILSASSALAGYAECPPAKTVTVTVTVEPTHVSTDVKPTMFDTATPTVEPTMSPVTPNVHPTLVEPTMIDTATPTVEPTIMYPVTTDVLPISKTETATPTPEPSVGYPEEPTAIVDPPPPVITDVLPVTQTSDPIVQIPETELLKETLVEEPGTYPTGDSTDGVDYGSGSAMTKPIFTFAVMIGSMLLSL